MNHIFLFSREHDVSTDCGVIFLVHERRKEVEILRTEEKTSG
jgi:hypothetical protein